jgi:hypothetical protein
MGKSMPGMWGLINTLQIINYSSMMTLYYPKITLMLFQFIGIVNMDNKYFSEVYRVHFDESVFSDREAWDYRFENQGIESTNILMNCSDVFFIILLFVLYFFIMLGIGCFIEPPPKKK